MEALQLELTRLTILATLWEAVRFAVVMWVLYVVIRAAIRDGINQSSIGKTAKPSPFSNK